jgi:hypothetical protein
MIFVIGQGILLEPSVYNGDQMKHTVYTLLLVATLILSGFMVMNVSAAAELPAAAAQTTVAPPADVGTLTTETKLIAGIYSLYGTSNAITADQAASLKTLFESYLSLTQSTMPTPSGTAQAQATPDANATPAPRQMPTVSAETQTKLDALLTQIQAVLTSTQLQAIEDLNLTQQTAMDVMMKYGVMGGGPGGQGQAQGTPQAGQQPPSGKGQGQPPAAQGTPQAGQQPSSGGQGQGQNPGNGGGPGGGMGGGSQMIEAFITFLTNVSTGTPVTTQAVPAA